MKRTHQRKLTAETVGTYLAGAVFGIGFVLGAVFLAGEEDPATAGSGQISTAPVAASADLQQ